MGRNDSKRMAYIDVMKGISIILVVAAHALMNNASSNADSEYAVFINFCAYVAVPTFFFINGYLYNHNYTLTPIKSLIRKFKAYYIPFVGFSLFFWLFHNVFVSLHMTTEPAYSITDYIKNFVLVFALHMESELNGPMWYLRALLIMVCMYIVIEYFCYKLQARKSRYIVLTAIVIAMFFLGKSGLITKVYNLNRIFYSMSFFYMGILFREFRLESFATRYKVGVFVVGLAVHAIYSLVYMGGLGVNVGLRDLPASYFGIIWMFAFSMFPFIQKSRLLELLGRASLDIMALHFVVFKMVSFVYITLLDLEITRLREMPVLKDFHGLFYVPYIIVALIVCTIEYKIRIKIKNIIKKSEIKEPRYV